MAAQTAHAEGMVARLVTKGRAQASRPVASEGPADAEARDRLEERLKDIVGASRLGQEERSAAIAHTTLGVPGGAARPARSGAHAAFQSTLGARRLRKTGAPPLLRRLFPVERRPKAAGAGLDRKMLRRIHEQEERKVAAAERRRALHAMDSRNDSQRQREERERHREKMRRAQKS
jgi:Zn-finger nucleic acid-binding protein